MWTDAHALAVCELARRRLSLPGGAHLLRAGHRTLARYGQVVVKVTCPGERTLSDAEAEAASAAWLRERGVAAPEHVTDPFIAADAVVSASRYLPDDDQPLCLAQLGVMIARLHNLSAPPGVRRGHGDGSEKIRRRICLLAGSGQITGQRAAALVRRIDWAQDMGEGRQALCHGDLHLGNTLMSAGRVHLLDLDRVRLGAAAEDLASLCCRTGKLALTDAQFDAFARAYTSV